MASSGLKWEATSFAHKCKQLVSSHWVTRHVHMKVVQPADVAMSAKHYSSVQGLRSWPRLMSEDITNMDVIRVGWVEMDRTNWQIYSSEGLWMFCVVSREGNFLTFSSKDKYGVSSITPRLPSDCTYSYIITIIITPYFCKQVQILNTLDM